jgi:carbon-monoxide dehydrogenase large subunit
MSLPGQVYAYVVRSPHAHARILGFGVGPAAGAPGVFAVLTGTDAAADGLQPIPQRPVPANPHEVPLRSRDGAPFLIAPHPVLALGKTRYVGEPVAVVVAKTLWQAMDAAERLAVEYNPLPAVVRSVDALALGAPLAWEEHGRNLCVDSETGDKAATELAFAEAAHVVRLQTAINRVTGVPMELRAAVGVYDEAVARYMVYTSAGGGVVRQRYDIAAVLSVPAAAVRVISGDVGGNFGIRNNTYPELALVAWAARRVGRPVKWSCERRDAFATDFHGRDLTSEAELALDEHRRFLAIRAVNTAISAPARSLFRPESKGSIHAKSPDPAAAPTIRPNYLADELDRRTLVAGLRIARRIVGNPALDRYRAFEMNPGDQCQSDDDFLNYARRSGQTAFHVIGTCKMGNDPMAVVDDELRVRGLKGLRVVDASIMPTMVSGNTNASE